MRKYLIFCIIYYLPCLVEASGRNSWYQINTPHYRFIFQKQFSKEVQRVANTAEYYYPYSCATLGVKPDPLSVILDYSSDIVNGNTILTPRSAMLYTLPSFDPHFSGSADWLDLLVVHEFRHVAQHTALSKHFSRLIYFLGGHGLVSTYFNHHIPLWFFEGDAVATETALTKSGRGRMPYFSLLHKANLLERPPLDYGQQVFESFKLNIPDHYVTGYHLVSYLRRHFGPMIWADILRYVSKLYIFPLAVHKATGLTLNEINTRANEELKQLWTKQTTGIVFTEHKVISPLKSEKYIHYTGPKKFDKNIVIALRSGPSTYSEFVKLLDGKIKKDVPLPLMPSIDEAEDMRFSVAKQKLSWIETVPDTFMGYKQKKTVIMVYDTKRRKNYILKQTNGGYSAAVLSPDAKIILAVDHGLSYKHRLVLLDAYTGTIRKQFPNPNNCGYLTPAFSSDGKHVIVIQQQEQNVALLSIHIETGVCTEWIARASYGLSDPCMGEKYIFYSSSQNGVDEIYAIDRSTKLFYQVTQSKYGAYYPSICENETTLYYSNFTKDGMEAVQIAIDPKNWIPIDKVPDRSLNYYAPLVTQEPQQINSIPKTVYPIKNYYPILNAFSLHSWQPDIDFVFSKYMSFGIKSDDLLKTLSLEAKCIYHTDRDNHWEADLTAKYTGLYPDLEFIMYKSKNKFHELFKSFDPLYRLYATFPLYYRYGNYDHKLSCIAGAQTQKINSNNIWLPFYGLKVERTRSKLERDLYIPWGQTLLWRLLYFPTENKPYKKDWILHLTLSFPGIFVHQNFKINMAYIYREQGIFNNELTPVWDYDTVPSFMKEQLGYRCLIGKIHALNFSYFLPIAYPDLSLFGGLFYIKRSTVTLKYYYSGHEPCNYDNRPKTSCISCNKKSKHIIVLDLECQSGLNTIVNNVHMGISLGYELGSDKLAIGWIMKMR